MRDREYLEPFAVQETFADDAEFEIKDGNLFITYLREIAGDIIAVHRVIVPTNRTRSIRAKAAKAIGDGQPKLVGVSG